MEKFGFVMVSKMLVEGKRKVRFMYREKGGNQDSGWRFFCGDEDQDYANNPDNIVICDIQTILDIDKSITPYLSAVAGSAYSRENADDIFQKSQDSRYGFLGGGLQLIGLIGKIRKITATDEYAMDFNRGASEEEITAFESKNKLAFPESIKIWLKFTNGCCLFNSTVQLYGITHTPLIDAEPKGVGNGFIEIGAFNYGDSVCIKSGQSTIFLCGETIIEYNDFEEFLEYVIEIGEGGQ